MENCYLLKICRCKNVGLKYSGHVRQTGRLVKDIRWEVGIRVKEEREALDPSQNGPGIKWYRLDKQLLTCTYLDLGPPVLLEASVTGDPAGSMPADTHLFQVFFGGASPCLLRPPPLSSAVFWHPVAYIAVCAGLSLGHVT